MRKNNKGLTAAQKLQRLRGVFSECGTFLLRADDELIGFSIFDKFSGELQDAASEDTLAELLEGGRIDDDIAKKCAAARDALEAIELYHNEEWNVQSVRKSQRWRVLLLRCDEINNMLCGR